MSQPYFQQLFEKYKLEQVLSKSNDNKLSRALATIDQLQKTVVQYYDQIFTNLGKKDEGKFAQLYEEAYKIKFIAGVSKSALEDLLGKYYNYRISLNNETIERINSVVKQYCFELAYPNETLQYQDVGLATLNVFMPLLHSSGKSFIKVLNKPYSYDKDATQKYQESLLSQTIAETDFFNSVLFDQTFNHRNEEIAQDYQFKFKRIQKFPKSGVKISKNIMEQQPSPE